MRMPRPIKPLPCRIAVLENALNNRNLQSGCKTNQERHARTFTIALLRRREMLKGCRITDLGMKMLDECRAIEAERLARWAA